MSGVQIKVLAERGFPSRLEAERAVNLINSEQSFYRLEHEEAVLPAVPEGRSLDFNRVHRLMQAKYGSSPIIVITHHKLKDGWIAYPKRDFYIFTTGRNRARPQLPPLSALFAYFIAGILGSLECRLTSQQTDTRTHMGSPIGCISDYCDTDEDLYVSMVGAHICEACKAIYRKYGLSEAGLRSIEQALEAVKDESLRYDRAVPYDVFVSYSNSDAAHVRPIVERFRDERFKVWYDDASLNPGETVKTALRASASEALCFVVALSPRSIKSKWCREELDAALRAQKPDGSGPRILPVLIADCRKEEIPNKLEHYKYADLRGEYKERDLKLLCSAVWDARHATREA
jgi:hypothetical protein